MLNSLSAKGGEGCIIASERGQGGKIPPPSFTISLMLNKYPGTVCQHFLKVWVWVRKSFSGQLLVIFSTWRQLIAVITVVIMTIISGFMKALLQYLGLTNAKALFFSQETKQIKHFWEIIIQQSKEMTSSATRYRQTIQLLSSDASVYMYI